MRRARFGRGVLGMSFAFAEAACLGESHPKRDACRIEPQVREAGCGGRTDGPHG